MMGGRAPRSRVPTGGAPAGYPTLAQGPDQEQGPGEPATLQACASPTGDKHVPRQHPVAGTGWAWTERGLPGASECRYRLRGTADSGRCLLCEGASTLRAQHKALRKLQLRPRAFPGGIAFLHLWGSGALRGPEDPTPPTLGQEGGAAADGPTSTLGATLGFPAAFVDSN